MDIQSYIYYLKEGEWLALFSRTDELKDIIRQIFFPPVVETGSRTEYFDWVKRTTVLIANLTGLSIKKILTADEYKQFAQWLVTDSLNELQKNDYKDTEEVIDYLNRICVHWEQDQERVLKDFCRELKPENDFYLTVFTIFLIERICDLQFYGVHKDDKKTLILQPQAEKFIEAMSRDRSLWMKIITKIKKYFAVSNAINMVKANIE
ncbi:MAG: hypothetical protein PHF84_12270 [bacterium]|nr:hypothetical protein [bacterium]